MGTIQEVLNYNYSAAICTQTINFGNASSISSLKNLVHSLSYPVLLSSTNITTVLKTFSRYLVDTAEIFSLP